MIQGSENQMIIDYSVTKNDRKELVRAIAEICGIPAIYNGAPSFSYSVGGITIDKAGQVEIPILEEATPLIKALRERGFKAEDPFEEVADELTIQMPRKFFTDSALENLQRLIKSKETLIKKAFGTDGLPIEITDETLSFPWFNEADGDTVKAYTQFIEALCKMAKEAKRVVSKEKPIENEKYVFRCFLLRLGFIGPEYSQSRKFLLKNLEGSSAFKNEGVLHAVSDVEN